MSASDQSPKQQIVDRLKDVDTVLVTVSRDPSVDELSAALGFTLLVNKLGKHGTAVFSGKIPPAITFLDPEKTFESTVDSLRDFIIALDKEKADHLRYKVDGDMVKIFITPYRTTISDKDLDFSQGDYNVEMVIAIGVQNNDDLDKALAEHGRILHDATVASLSMGSDRSDLGSISWHESGVSSYSEMLVSIAESLRSDKNLLDDQIATAFLTGIVAATERFSNQLTTSKTMTMAAQLMAAGANQQLIATKLAENNVIDDSGPPDNIQNDDLDKKTNNDGSTDLHDDELTKVGHIADKDDPVADAPAKDTQAPDGSMTISHEPKGDVDEVAEQMHAKQQAQATETAERHLSTIEGLRDGKVAEAEADLSATLNAAAPASGLSVADLQKDLQAASDEINDAAENPSPQPDMTLPPVAPNPQYEPSLGGTLNATTDQAAEDKRRALDEDKNKTILSHGSQYVGHAPTHTTALNSFTPGAVPPAEPPSVSPFGGASSPTAHGATVTPAPATEPASTPVPTQVMTLADLDQHNRTAPPSVVESAPASSFPPMPDFSTLPPLPGADTSSQALQAGLPPLPAAPVDFSAATPSTPNDAAVAPADPGQFQIPGQ